MEDSHAHLVKEVSNDTIPLFLDYYVLEYNELIDHIQVEEQKRDEEQQICRLDGDGASLLRRHRISAGIQDLVSTNGT